MKYARTFGLLVPALLVAGTARGQDAVASPDVSKTHGFTVGVHLNGSGLEVQGGDAEGGSGGGLRLGYGVSNHVTIFLDGDAAAMERDYTLVHVGLGVRGSFRSTAHKLRPFVEGAFVGVAAGDTYAGSDVVLSGGGLHVGGGLEYFFSRAVALDLGLSVGPGSFTRAS